MLFLHNKVLSFSWFNHFYKLGQKNVKLFVGFLGYKKTRLFAFEIYWPLVELAHELADPWYNTSISTHICTCTSSESIAQEIQKKNH